MSPKSFLGVYLTALVSPKSLLGVYLTALVSPKSLLGVYLTALVSPKSLSGVYHTALVSPKSLLGVYLTALVSPKSLLGVWGVVIDTLGYFWIPFFLDTWQIFGIQVSKYPKKKHVFTPNFLTLGTHRGRGLGLNSLLL